MTSHFVGMALEVNTSKSTLAKNTEWASSHEIFFFSASKGICMIYSVPYFIFFNVVIVSLEVKSIFIAT